MLQIQFIRKEGLSHAYIMKETRRRDTTAKTLNERITKGVLQEEGIERRFLHRIIHRRRRPTTTHPIAETMAKM